MQALIDEIVKRGWAFDLHSNAKAGNHYAVIYEAKLDPGFIDTGPVHGASPQDALWKAFTVMAARIDEKRKKTETP